MPKKEIAITIENYRGFESNIECYFNDHYTIHIAIYFTQTEPLCFSKFFGGFRSVNGRSIGLIELLNRYNYYLTIENVDRLRMTLMPAQLTLEPNLILDNPDKTLAHCLLNGALHSIKENIYSFPQGLVKVGGKRVLLSPLKREGPVSKKVSNTLFCIHQVLMQELWLRDKFEAILEILGRNTDKNSPFRSRQTHEMYLKMEADLRRTAEIVNRFGLRDFKVDLGKGMPGPL